MANTIVVPGTATSNRHTYIVEHLDPELGPWSALEYICIAQESGLTGNAFVLTSVKDALLPQLTDLKGLPGASVWKESVHELYGDDKGRICLLDPAAKTDLIPEDGERFKIFLFGGILGTI